MLCKIGRKDKIFKCNIYLCQVASVCCVLYVVLFLLFRDMIHTLTTYIYSKRVEKEEEEEGKKRVKNENTFCRSVLPFSMYVFPLFHSNMAKCYNVQTITTLSLSLSFSFSSTFVRGTDTSNVIRSYN